MKARIATYRILGLLCCCMFQLAFAQNTITVYDAESTLGLPYANIVLTEVSSGSRSKTVSDENGTFDIPFNLETKVEISYIGYQGYLKTIDPKKTRAIYMFPYESPIDEIVVTANTEETTQSESLVQVNVINRTEIAQRGAVNLRDALTNELNIKLTQDGVLGTTISMQGLSGENVKVMIDGVPIIGRQGGNIDLSQINLNNIERIEVVEGPLSVIYGTNAIAGVINLITKKGQQESVNAYVNGFYESTGIYNADASIGIKKNRHFVQFSGGRNFFDGWHPTSFVRDQLWNPKESYYGEANYVIRSEKNWFHRFKGNFYKDQIMNRYDPFVFNPIPKAFEDWYHTRRIDGAYLLNGRINDHFLFNSTNSYNGYQRIKNSYLKDLTTMESSLTMDEDGNVIDQDTTVNFQVMSRSFFTYNPKKTAHSIQFGYDVSVEAGRGQRFEGEDGGNAMIADAAVFAAFNLQPHPKWEIQPSIRYGYNSQFATIPTPSVALKFKGNDHWNYKFSYGMGYRTPSLKELYLVFFDSNHRIFGNSELTPEKSHNLQTSLSYSNSFNLHRVTQRVSTFYNYKYNAIALTAAQNDTFTYVNIANFSTLGFQWDGGYSYKGFKMNAGFTLLGLGNEESKTDPTLHRLFFAPQVQVNLSYQIAKSNTRFSWYNKYNGATYDYVLASGSNTQSLERVRIADYLLSDFTVSQAMWNKKISLQAGVRNLFNVSEIEGTFANGVHTEGNNTQIGTGRSYFVGLKIGWNK